MKYLKLLSIFWLASLALHLAGQDHLYFSGQVTEANTGFPVIQQQVTITTADSLQLAVSFTNQQGFYYDSIPVDSSGYAGGIFVTTQNCDGTPLTHVFQVPDSMNVADFEVCQLVSDCEAFFIYEPDSLNPYLLHFFDMSSGEITSWFWSFGDGTTSGEQDPSHQYNAPGTYEICLTVYAASQNCQSTWCILINVEETNCSADFTYATDTLEPLIVYFEDQSTGNIDHWQWDFGDGMQSQAQSPTHTYANAGDYLVTLTISDSAALCYDQAARWISVGAGQGCEAIFSFTLDTLNNTPRVYLFTNQSGGNYNSIFWDFGDGSVSQEENPSHTYEEQGTYEVCLQIAGPDSSCFDQYCETITTMEYYDFGGQVFIGEYPMNVEPDDSSNVALATLYRRIDNRWEWMDSREFWKFGYYWFVQKPVGEYLLRAELLPEAEEYGDYSPTYRPDVRFWQNASRFILTDSGSYAVNIRFREMADADPGTGMVAGHLFGSASCIAETNIIGELIYLMNDEGEIIEFAHTDETGYYAFTGLAFGEYAVKAEVPGKESEIIPIYLSQGDPNQDDIDIGLSCNAFVGLDEPMVSTSPLSMLVYPQPADHDINFEVKGITEANLLYELTGISGKTIRRGTVSAGGNSSRFKLEIGDIPSGIYIFKVSERKSGNFVIQKIIVN